LLYLKLCEEGCFRPAVDTARNYKLAVWDNLVGRGSAIV
jgi:hypothetical protein